MPIANDVATGGRKAEVDRDIIAATAGSSRTSEPSRTSASPIVSQGDHLRGPEHPSNASGHTNPVPTNLFAPERDALLERATAELAMRTGALTTVPEVEDRSTGVAVWDAALARGGRDTSAPFGTVPSYGAGARAGAPSVDLAAQHRTEAADQESVAEGMRQSDRRATRQGMREGGRADKIKAMTADAFAELSPRQKAAVELNSMLTAAIEADRGDASAPATSAILEQIGWEAPEGAGLKDILSGKALFTRQDIADLEMPENQGGTDARLNTSMKMRDDLQSSLARAFASSRKEPIQGQNLLVAKRDLLDYEKMPGFKDGGREVVPGVSLGKYIQSGFDMLANSNTTFTPEQIIDDARQHLTDQEFQSFLNFVDINSRDAKNYRQPLGTNTEQTYFDPVEFRKSIAAELRKAR